MVVSDVLPAVIDLATVRRLYAGGWTPERLLATVSARIDAADPAAFISRATALMLAEAVAALRARAPEPNSLPLWGVPFAVKDNIDVAGLPTTCACTALDASAALDAVVVARLVAAGAIPIGKTNLDQFATGLNGTRSPYGAPRSVFDAAHISGGSSSGSAVAVAAGLASFALGTDTAGSGRVPAALNNIVGIKPTPGLLSSTGMVPACRSLDCISIFALSAADGGEIRRVAEGFDPADAYSRGIVPHPLPVAGLRVGILPPAQRRYFGWEANDALYEAAITALEAMPVEIDFAPFGDTAALLYEGAWVAERQVAMEAIGVPPDTVDPAVAAIVAGAPAFSAADAFRGLYRLEALRRLCAAQWARMDVLLVPSAPRSYTVAEMLADPIRLNSHLGTYTNFANLLGLSAIAVPAGFGVAGLPFGVTLLAPGGADEALLPLADRLHRAAGCGAGIDRAFVPPPLASAPPLPDRLTIGVVGAHLSGMPLNHELTSLGGELVGPARTTADYRLFVLPDTNPPKPGLVRAPGFSGPGIALELWSLSPEAFGRFTARIPSPLGIGKVALADGRDVSAFLCEGHAVEGAREITALGGWRAFVAAPVA